MLGFLFQWFGFCATIGKAVDARGGGQPGNPQHEEPVLKYLPGVGIILQYGVGTILDILDQWQDKTSPSPDLFTATNGCNLATTLSAVFSLVNEASTDPKVTLVCTFGAIGADLANLVGCTYTHRVRVAFFC